MRVGTQLDAMLINYCCSKILISYIHLLSGFNKQVLLIENITHCCILTIKVDNMFAGEQIKPIIFNY